MSLPFHVKRSESESITKTRETSETYAARRRFYAELFVEHSPLDVWSYFTDLTKWRQWSPICRGCRLSDDHGELRSGGILEITFAIVGFAMTIPCRLIQVDAPKSITWQGEKFGIQATHRYIFLPLNDGTLMCNEEVFTSVRFPLGRMICVLYRASKLGEKSLQGIKRELLKTN